MSRRLLLLIVLLLGLGLGLWLLLTEPGGRPPVPQARPEAAGPVEPVRDLGGGATPSMEAEPARPTAGSARTEAAAEGVAAAVGRTLPLQVLSLRDEPIPGARVSWSIAGREGEETTDAGGRCVVGNSRERQVLLRVEAEGWFHAAGHFPTRDEIVVRLHPAVPLAGRVLTTNRREPIAGAKIRFLDPHDVCDAVEVESDAVGAYAFAGVPVGQTLVFHIEPREVPPQTSSFTVLEEGAGVVHDFLLPPGVEIEGLVLDLETRRPIAGARVTRARRGSEEALTDATGAFRGRFIQNEIGEFLVHVSAAGHCSLEALLALGERGAQDFPPLLLPRPARVEGVVVDREGEPVPDAHVELVEDRRATTAAVARGAGPAELADVPRGWVFLPPRHSGPWQGALRDLGGTRTDEQGRFASEDLVPLTPLLRVRVVHPAHGSFEVDAGPLGLPGETTRLELSFASVAERGSIAGYLLLEGQPVPGSVVLRPRSTAGGRTARVDADGGYRLDGVEPGIVDLLATPVHQRTGGIAPPAEQRRARVEVRPGGETRCDFLLTLPGGMATIEGRVLSEAGAPLAGVKVVARCFEEPGSFTATSREQGEFKLRVPSQLRAFELEATDGERSAWLDDVPPGASDLELRFPPMARAFLRAIDAHSDRPLKPFDVYLRAAGGGPFRQVSLNRSGRGWASDPAGWIETELPVGVYDLMVRQDRAGFVPAVLHNVSLYTDREPVHLEARLERGAVAIFELKEGQQPLPARQKVLLVEAEHFGSLRGRGDRRDLFPAGALRHRELRFDARGRARVEGLLPGTYRFRALPGDVRVMPARVEVKRRQKKPILLSWAPVK